MTTHRKKTRKGKTLRQWWHEQRRAHTRRKASRAKRAKERAEDLKTRNAARKTLAEARELRAVAVREHRAQQLQKRVAAAARRQARMDAAAPVVRTVTGVVMPAETPSPIRAGAAQAAGQCRAPTLDGSPCENLVTDGRCSAGHVQRPRRPVTGAPLTGADRRFFARRDEGYSGPLDADGNPVTRVTGPQYDGRRR